MEIALKMGVFDELSREELNEIDGGNVGTAIGMTVVTVALIWAAPVGLIMGSAWAAGALAFGGAGLAGKLTGLY